MPDLDLYLDISIQTMGILMSGALIQSNASFRKKPRKISFNKIPLYRLQKQNKRTTTTKPPKTKKTHNHQKKPLNNKKSKPQNQSNKKTPNQQWVWVISGLEYLIAGWQTYVVCFSESRVAFLKKQNICARCRERTQSLLTKAGWAEKPKKRLGRKRLRWYLEAFPSGSSPLPSLKSQLFSGTMVGKPKSVVLGLRNSKGCYMVDGWCLFLIINLKGV